MKGVRNFVWIILFIGCFRCNHCVFSIYVFHAKTDCKNVNEEEFRAGYRKAQLIDVREPNEFENGHILEQETSRFHR